MTSSTALAGRCSETRSNGVENVEWQWAIHKVSRLLKLMRNEGARDT